MPQLQLQCLKAREQILEVHARKKKLGDDVDLGTIAKNTAGFVGADLENVLNEAAIIATRTTIMQYFSPVILLDLRVPSISTLTLRQ